MVPVSGFLQVVVYDYKTHLFFQFSWVPKFLEDFQAMQ